MPLVNTRGAASAQALGYAARSTDAAYIEDVFSTYLYTGNGSTQTITNGVDLSTKSGLVWIKRRDTVDSHALYDTLRGINRELSSNTTAAQSTTDRLPAFNSNGFNIASGLNTSLATYASWTFRKQAKFFDVVTYTGDGTGTRAIPHNLGSVPGCIIVKYYSGTSPGGSAWYVYHRGMTTPATQFMRLSGTGAQATTTIWGSTSPTATDFYVATTTLNQNGTNYVAYVFAHDAGGFGASGTDNVITCGSFTTNASGNATVSLGYEPQMCIFKPSSAVGNWDVFDNMRGYLANTSGTNQKLSPNLSSAEVGSNYTFVNSTGFTTLAAAASTTYVYIAIRRGPMRTPTSGTSVFSPVTYTGNNASTRTISSSVTVDSSWIKPRWAAGPTTVDRLRGGGYIRPNSSSSEDTTTTYYPSNPFSTQTGVIIGDDAGGNGYTNTSTQPYINWQFRRAPGFFDVVCYTGTGSARTVTHNLGIVPEMIITKTRSVAEGWRVYHSNPGATKRALLYTDDAFAVDSTAWNNTAPTASVFTVGTDNSTNQSGQTLVAYLFGSVTGVSKVGSYTGSGTTKQIDCGFTGGARFVLIKRADSTGDWYIWDSARGIVAGDDPYVLINSSAAENTSTDYIDTYSAGFEISSTAPAAINANGGTFIFLAIA